MAASDWGMCKDCQWWQIDPGATIADHTMGLCTEYAWRAGAGRRVKCGPADRGAATLHEEAPGVRALEPPLTFT
jgi:hypothetical protein